MQNEINQGKDYSRDGCSHQTELADAIKNTRLHSGGMPGKPIESFFNDSLLF